MTSHARCKYISPDNIECEIWFATSDQEFKLCPLHRDSIAPALAANGINKDQYIMKRSAAEISCATMTDAELDAHIAHFEAIIEEAKMNVLVGKATVRTRESKLTDDERKARRLIRAPKLQSIDSNGVKKESKASKEKATIKSNPIRFLMDRNAGLTREKAITMLGLSEEEASRYV